MMTKNCIRNIEIEHFLSFRERTTVGFSPGLNVITGPNGMGKSNLLRALFYGYLGKGAESVKGLALAHLGSSAKLRVNCVPKMMHCLEVFDKLGEIDLTEESRAGLLDAVPGMAKSEALWHCLSESFERYTAELLAEQGDAHLKDARGTKGRLIPFGVNWNGCDDERCLSGGERSLLNLAFVLALSECFEGPIVLDDVTARLDRKQGERVAALLKGITKSRQVIIVSRHDSILAEADRILGVSWDKKKNCSKVTVLNV